MAEASNKARPEFRNIHISQIRNYRLPLAGKVSILHRVSGIAMFALLPFVLYLLEQSLTSEISFDKFSGFMAATIFSIPVVKIIVLGLIWAYLHHFCAGIRFLTLDLHLGIDKHTAQKSAGTVLAISLVLTAVFGAKLFGLF